MNYKPVSFSLGRIVATPGALAALKKVKQAPIEYLQRHAKGDWGEGLCEEDKQANHQALQDGTRILSAYKLPDETRLWIITDGVINKDTGERYATTLLLPEEY
jgi:hypothetical protein